MLFAMKHLWVSLLFLMFIFGTSLVFSQSDENLEGVYIGSDVAYRGASEESLGTPPPDYVEITQEPQIIFKKEPIPVLDADGSVIEGNVFLKLWVGADSVVKKAVLLRADNQNLVRSSLIAAIQYRFSPAIINGKPVDVWMSVPFKYRKK
jgi:hypothetical protein